MTSLNKISTQWTQIEALQQNGELRALTNYLAAKYFSPLIIVLKRSYPYLSELQSHELASDVFYEFFKNDYQTVRQIKRDKGKLRGLFYKIIRCQLSSLSKSSPPQSPLENFHPHAQGVESYIDIFIDLESALELLKKERPRLYEPFIFYSFQGKSISKIGQLLQIKEDAVKQRICSARKFLDQNLKEYKA